LGGLFNFKPNAHDKPDIAPSRGEEKIDSVGRAPQSLGSAYPLRVKPGNTHREQMFSALPLKADIRRAAWDVRFVPNPDIAGTGCFKKTDCQLETVIFPLPAQVLHRTG
jgi:hypothetical protein